MIRGVCKDEYFSMFVKESATWFELLENLSL